MAGAAYASRAPASLEWDQDQCFAIEPLPGRNTAFPEIRFYDYTLMSSCQVRQVLAIIQGQRQVAPAHPRTTSLRNQALRVRPPASQRDPASAVRPR